MVDAHSLRLAHSGLLANLDTDSWHPDCWVLSIDGTPQSHIDLTDARSLHFDYVARMGNIIDLAFPAQQSITALHLGAGGMTIPRYVEATRPGSRQQVVEIERELVDFVRTVCPLPQSASIRFRYGDAREIVEKLPGGLVGAVDLVVVDVYRGSRTPAHVTSVEFYERLRRLLRPDGIVLANLSDGPPLTFTRNQFATLRYAFGSVFGVAEYGVAAGKRFGNIVACAALSDSDPEWSARVAGLGPHPSSLIGGDDARAWARSGVVVTDATAIDSPPPSRKLFRT